MNSLEDKMERYQIRWNLQIFDNFDLVIEIDFNSETSVNAKYMQ